jgi:hypothetical protein
MSNIISLKIISADIGIVKKCRKTRHPFYIRVLMGINAIYKWDAFVFRSSDT